MNTRSIVMLCSAVVVAACQQSPTPLSPGTVATPLDSYVITDLGTLGGTSANAHQINALGHVAGRAQNAAGETRAFLWDGVAMRDLGPATTYATSVHLNDNDQVAWTSTTADGSTHAFLWDNGAARDLGTLGGTSSRAVAINNLGQVVGTSSVDATSSHAFLWQDGVITDLGTLGGASSRPTAINDRGQIVGTSDLDSSSSHAFLWQDGAMTDLGVFSPVATNKAGWIVGTSSDGPPSGPHYAMLWREGELISLGTLPGDFSSHAVAVNARGEIAGSNCRYLGCDERHPFVWKAGKMTALDPEYSFPYWQGVTGINDDGLVIGDRRVNSHTTRGVVWEVNGIGQNLGTLGGAQSSASAVNGLGTVVGSAETASGERHAVLWLRVAVPAIVATNP